MKNVWFLACMLCIGAFINLEGEEQNLPEKMLKIMQQPKYQHSYWGIFAKDIETGATLFDVNSNQLFLPGSVSKLFPVAALLHTYGDNYRFKTPVYMNGKIENGILKGSLILVGQGDLTLGGRQGRTDAIAFTKMDHIYANDIPGAVLTKEDPLHGLNELAKQIREQGVSQIDGRILVDDRLFETTEKRGFMLTPLMVNENIINITIKPALSGEIAKINWRPHVPDYFLTNKVKTVAKDEPLEIKITSDELGRSILVEGTIPINKKEVVRSFLVKDPQHFARAAFIQALHNQGIKTNFNEEESVDLPAFESYRNMQPIAIWASPPLSEYAKLILKVSHNLGADLIPLLLAVRNHERTFDEGMLLLGEFIEQEVKVARGNFVFVDAAGGDSNRLTPQAVIKLLDYIQHLPKKRFQNFHHALPILGVDGSLADFGKNTGAVGKVFAKTGTGISYNLSISEFFLTTQALAGYINGKNGHLIEFMIAVNNAQAPHIEDLLSIFEDQGEMAAIIFDVAN